MSRSARHNYTLELTCLGIRHIYPLRFLNLALLKIMLLNLVHFMYAQYDGGEAAMIKIELVIIDCWSKQSLTERVNKDNLIGLSYLISVEDLRWNLTKRVSTGADSSVFKANSARFWRSRLE